MEISGKVLREVEFRDRLRGYDTDEVDEFLEKVAVGIDQMRAELQRLNEQPARPPERVEPATPTLDDDSIRRTLILAQRTADLAIKEANDEAARVLSEAQNEAGALLNDAKNKARLLRDEAEEDLHARVARLGDYRAQLEREVQSLARVLENERERLRSGLAAALRVVEESVTLSDEAAALAASVPAKREPIDMFDALSGDPSEGLSGSAKPTPPPSTGRTESQATPGEQARDEHSSENGRALGLDNIEAQISEDAEKARTSSRDLGGVDPLDPDEELWARWTQGADLGSVPDPDGADPFGLDRDRRGRGPSAS